MRSLGRRIAWLIPLLLCVVGLLWPLLLSGASTTSGPLSDPVTISSMRAEFTVDPDGLMRATETITAEFPSGRHGIFRYWDVANQNDSHIRQVPQVDEISLDGEPVPYDFLWKNGERFLVAKIGDPDSYVRPGTHIYQIRYSIPGVLDPGTTGEDRQFASVVGNPAAPSVFFWNVIAPGWSNDIERAEISVHCRPRCPGRNVRSDEAWADRAMSCPLTATLCGSGRSISHRGPRSRSVPGSRYPPHPGPACRGHTAGIRSSDAPCRWPRGCSV